MTISYCNIIRFADTNVKIQQMQNVLIGLVLTYGLSLLSTILSSIPVLSLQVFTFIVVMADKVAVMATMFAFLTHV
jgi:hypothetical protein